VFTDGLKHYSNKLNLENVTAWNNRETWKLHSFKSHHLQLYILVTIPQKHHSINNL